jgi:hypothetical protein
VQQEASLLGNYDHLIEKLVEPLIAKPTTNFRDLLAVQKSFNEIQEKKFPFAESSKQN